MNSDIQTTHELLSSFNRGGCKDWSLYNNAMAHYEQQLKKWEEEDKAFYQKIAQIRAMRNSK